MARAPSTPVAHVLLGSTAPPFPQGPRLLCLATRLPTAGTAIHAHRGWCQGCDSGASNVGPGLQDEGRGAAPQLALTAPACPSRPCVPARWEHKTPLPSPGLPTPQGNCDVQPHSPHQGRALGHVSGLEGVLMGLSRPAPGGPGCPLHCPALGCSALASTSPLSSASWSLSPPASGAQDHLSPGQPQCPGGGAVGTTCSASHLQRVTP